MLKNTILLMFIALSASLITASSYAKGPGDKAEDFTLTGIDGSSYNLSGALENSKNGVIVIFWSTECPWVQPYNDRINDYIKDMNNKGFTVWGINANNTESLDDVKVHAKKNSYEFPMLKDIGNTVADMLGATRTPEAYMIAKDKTILYHGRISDNRYKAEEKSNDLGNAAADVSLGKEVAVKETKSFGCGIKKDGQDN